MNRTRMFLVLLALAIPACTLSTGSSSKGSAKPAGSAQSEQGIEAGREQTATDASSTSSSLREADAKRAAEALLVAHGSWGDGPYKMLILESEWQGLTRVSASEARGKAKLTYGYVGQGGTQGHMDGSYVFHKTSRGTWVLDRMDFSDKRNSIEEKVSQPVGGKATATR